MVLNLVYEIPLIWKTFQLLQPFGTMKVSTYGMWNLNPSQGNPYLNCRWEISKSIISFAWYLFLLILWRNITHKQGKKRGRFLLPVKQLGSIALSCSLIHTSPLIQQIPSEFWVCSVLTNWAIKRRNNIIIPSQD